MKHATLTITRTGTECAAYRLSDGSGCVVWRNRVYDVPEGHRGDRERLAAWAIRRGYKVIERKDAVKRAG